jgi:hypothetical protein
MASDQQIAANRKNAILSRGPRTMQGLSVSRTNARKHGLSSPVTDDRESQLRIAAIQRVLLLGVDPGATTIDLLPLAEYHADMHRIRGAKLAVSPLHHSDGGEFLSKIRAVLKLDRYAKAALSKLNATMRDSEDMDEKEGADQEAPLRKYAKRTRSAPKLD